MEAYDFAEQNYTHYISPLHLVYLTLQ